MVSTYFVANGTGNQGGAVIDQLLLINPKPIIRTTSRDLNSDAGIHFDLFFYISMN